jgi:hypothetical protein
MALKTYAEFCLEVAGLLEISATDFDRMNMANSINRAIKHILGVTPVNLVPECIRSKQLDFELNGYQEVPLDFVRRIKVRVIYAGSKSVPCEWIPPIDWPPTTANHLPTTENPVYSHVADLNGTPSTNGRGFMAVLPLPTPAKVTNGFWLQYLGFGDAVDSGHGIPLNPKLWSPLLHKTCEYVCLVENYDVQRAAIFKQEYNDEMAELTAAEKLNKSEDG